MGILWPTESSLAQGPQYADFRQFSPFFPEPTISSKFQNFGRFSRLSRHYFKTLWEVCLDDLDCHQISSLHCLIPTLPTLPTLPTSTYFYLLYLLYLLLLYLPLPTLPTYFYLPYPPAYLQDNCRTTAPENPCPPGKVVTITRLQTLGSTRKH